MHYSRLIVSELEIPGSSRPVFEMRTDHFSGAERCCSIDGKRASLANLTLHLTLQLSCLLVALGGL